MVAYGLYMGLKMRAVVIPSLILSIFLIKVEARSIKVIEFKTDFTAVSKSNNEETDQDGMETTREITGCLRFNPQKHRDYFLLYTDQFNLILNGERNGFITFNNANINYNKGGAYSRLFAFCQSRIPGLWTSMCFSMKFTETTQLVKIFQGGKKCSERFYSKGNFGYLYYKMDEPVKK